MALKKSQLYSSLWQSCDELRGGMDASQYKDYVLTLLFMKYVSDKHAGDPNALIEVPPGGGFADMAKLQGDKEIGDRINKIIARLAEANELKGVIDQADFNDESKLGAGKEMQDRLSKLVAIFEGLDFRANRAGGDDLLGDAYEYLMRHFATESGKSKGQFYTPAEVSRIMARVVGIGPDTRQDQTIYDPTCGSGSLLLKAADEAPGGISVYGQEMDNATWSLARMNLILHGHETAEVWRGNTLAAPYFKNPAGGLRTFDFAVANPPFSAKAWSNGLDPLNDEFRRFAYGVPPARNGDYAFLLHLVASLGSRGKGAIILPHGVLFRGNREAGIRRSLIRRGFIKGIIGLPANLFYGTGIPACIVVIDKEHAAARDGIFMVDASKGFLKDGAKNRLREQDIHRIVDVFNRQGERPGYARMVPVAEIASTGQRLQPQHPPLHRLQRPRGPARPRRAPEGRHPRPRRRCARRLLGGLPLATRDLVHGQRPRRLLRRSRRDAAGEGRHPGARGVRNIQGTGRRRPRRLAQGARATPSGHRRRDPPQGAHRRPVGRLARTLRRPAAARPLRPLPGPDGLLGGDHAGRRLSRRRRGLARGRSTARGHRGQAEEDQGDAGSERQAQEVQAGSDPPGLVVARYFDAERQVIEALQVEHESAARELEEHVEEHGGEDGPLEDALTDKGKVTKAGVQSRLKAIRGEDDPDSEVERGVLSRCLTLIQAEAKAAKAVKTAQASLDERVLARYGVLTEAEIKTLVIEDKWLAGIRSAVDGEVQRLTRRLAARIQELEERYADPLPKLECRVADFGARVEGHLRRMGLSP